MTRKRTNRLHWAKINPIDHAIYQAAKLTTAEWNTQVIPVQVAIDQLLIGNWHKLNVWNPVFEAVNKIEAMLKLAHMPDNGFLDRVRGVFVVALDREAVSGVKAFKSGELAVMREIVQVYGDLLKEVNLRRFQEACDYTNANVTRILKTKTGVENHNHCLIEVAA